MALETERVREIAERVAASSGLEVVEIDLRGGGKSRRLRIVIDRPAAGTADNPSGVTHEDCAILSREVGTILDVEDVVPGSSYVLEVSSPGLDRKLARAADFERFTGSLVKLMTREPIEGNRFFEGRLEAFENGRLTLDLAAVRKAAKNAKKKGRESHEAPQKIEIDFGNVEKANLVPEF
jgi:ribosome maturation factor RimP